MGQILGFPQCSSLYLLYFFFLHGAFIWFSPFVLVKLGNILNSVSVSLSVSLCLIISPTGRCLFRQYMPSKLTRYGIKIWVVCDAWSSYAWKMQVYASKPDKLGPLEKNLATRVDWRPDAFLFFSSRPGAAQGLSIRN